MIKMLSYRIQKYIDDHSFCSEYLFKDWEAFLDFIYEEGGRVSSILWWEHCNKKMNRLRFAEILPAQVFVRVIQNEL